LGTHRGLGFYTVGQRKGLGISWPEPLYVLRIECLRNSLVVGPADALGRMELTAGEVSFVSGEWPTAPLRVTAKVRYQAQDKPATVYPLGYERVRVVLDHPLRGISPGQAVVFYDGDTCLGGGLIE
jgi:tRNA-specific 2-thiouridylase